MALVLATTLWLCAPLSTLLSLARNSARLMHGQVERGGDAAHPAAQSRPPVDGVSARASGGAALARGLRAGRLAAEAEDARELLARLGRFRLRALRRRLCAREAVGLAGGGEVGRHVVRDEHRTALLEGEGVEAALQHAEVGEAVREELVHDLADELRPKPGGALVSARVSGREQRGSNAAVVADLAQLRAHRLPHLRPLRLGRRQVPRQRETAALVLRLGA
mmetsp:Transcript_10896/g.34924  ORF Transcript_10896/g.34924 Transcript_10896/m.34924 type:complete len:222 (-) Transcript_10896:1389-2054(-)